MNHPIQTAVSPLRAEAIARSVESMRAAIERCVSENPVGSEFSAKFPRLNRNTSRRAYAEARAARSGAGACVSVKAADYRITSAEFVVGRNEAGIESLLAGAEATAAAAFDAYVAKLSAKVGECDAASVVGPLWTGSVLTVSKGATIERWTTRMIVNVSCLGKLFNQFPTRLAK
jgi:hypothetical protein